VILAGNDENHSKVLRAYPKTDRDGDSGDFEFGHGAATTADQRIDPPWSRDAAQTQNPLVPQGFLTKRRSRAVLG
jgi:hypothetical protein